jgi:hypothetical protein
MSPMGLSRMGGRLWREMGETSEKGVWRWKMGDSALSGCCRRYHICIHVMQQCHDQNHSPNLPPPRPLTSLSQTNSSSSSTAKRLTDRSRVQRDENTMDSSFHITRLDGRAKNRDTGGLDAFFEILY